MQYTSIYTYLVINFFVQFWEVANMTLALYVHSAIFIASLSMSDSQLFEIRKYDQH